MQIIAIVTSRSNCLLPYQLRNLPIVRTTISKEVLEIIAYSLNILNWQECKKLHSHYMRIIIRGVTSTHLPMAGLMDEWTRVNVCVHTLSYMFSPNRLFSTFFSYAIHSRLSVYILTVTSVIRIHLQKRFTQTSFFGQIYYIFRRYRTDTWKEQ